MSHCLNGINNVLCGTFLCSSIQLETPALGERVDAEEGSNKTYR